MYTTTNINTFEMDKRKQRNRNSNYVNGVPLTMLNKIAKYEFGKAFIHSYNDRINKQFVFIVDSKVEAWQINRFSQYWQVEIQYLTTQHIPNRNRNERAERHDKRKLNYVGGITISVMNKIAYFEFGENFITSYKDEKAETFCMIVKDVTPDWQCKKFSDFFKVKVLHASKR